MNIFTWARTKIGDSPLQFDTLHVKSRSKLILIQTEFQAEIEVELKRPLRGAVLKNGATWRVEEFSPFLIMFRKQLHLFKWQNSS